MTLLELILACAILLILSSAAVPIARQNIVRVKENELRRRRYDLEEDLGLGISACRGTPPSEEVARVADDLGNANVVPDDACRADEKARSDSASSGVGHRRDQAQLAASQPRVDLGEWKRIVERLNEHHDLAATAYADGVVTVIARIVDYEGGFAGG